MQGRYLDIESPVSDHALNVGLGGWWWWPTNRAAGNVVQDLKRANNGTWTGGPVWSVGPSKQTGSVSTNGSSTFVNCGTITGLNGSTNTTFCGWVYRNATNITAGFGGCGGNSVAGGNRCSLIWFTDGKLYTAIDGVGAGNYQYLTLGGVGWHHITVTYIGSTYIRAFVDGAVVALTTSTIPPAMGNATPWNLGKDCSDRFCAGSCADVRVWPRRTLVADEVAELYQQSLRGNPDLLNWLPKRSFFGPQPPVTTGSFNPAWAMQSANFIGTGVV